MFRRIVTMALGLAVTAILTPSFPAVAGMVPQACIASAHHQDAAHTGFSCASLPSSVGRKWSVTLNVPTSYPAIAGGKCS
jgi:hypothetical protein